MTKNVILHIDYTETPYDEFMDNIDNACKIQAELFVNWLVTIKKQKNQKNVS